MGLSQEYDWNWGKKVDVKLSETSKTITLERDLLDRSKYASFLTNTLNSYENSSVVLNLNAEWGAGKTWFIRRWYSTIKEINPSVYIDAWKSDYSEDPLLTVISGIKESLSQYNNARSEHEKENVLKYGGRFLKQVTPSLMSALLKTYTGFDSESFKLEDFSDFSEKALGVCLDNHNQTGKEIDLFKESIGRWLDLSINSHGNGLPKKPMYIFIDELDRCRPTYAIELLEIVKHLFDVPGLVFVIATNTNQLQHSIKSIYGTGFDANRYLYRFFTRSYTLADPAMEYFISCQDSFYSNCGLANGLECVLNETLSVTGKDNIARNLASIANFFQFDLRTTQQWLDQLLAALVFNKCKDSYFWITFSMLSALKLYNPEFFSRLYNKTYSIEYGRRAGIEDISSNIDSLAKRSNESVKFSFCPKYIRKGNVRNGCYIDYEKFFDVEVKVFNLFVACHDLFFNGEDYDDLLFNICEGPGTHSGVNSVKVYKLAQTSYNEKYSTGLKNYVDLVSISTDFK